jgi:CRP-like cAMP-binding protein
MPTQNSGKGQLRRGLATQTGPTPDPFDPPGPSEYPTSKITDGSTSSPSISRSGRVHIGTTAVEPQSRLPLTRTQTPLRGHVPKVQDRFLASKLICLDLNGLLPPKAGARPARFAQLPAPNALAAGDAIELPGHRSAFLVERGAVDLVLPRRSGWVPVKRLGPGAIFGEIPMVGLATLGAQAVAAMDSQIVILDENALQTIIRKSPAIALRVIETLGSRVLESDVDLIIKRFGTTDSKLTNLLLKLADEDEVIAAVSQQDLANILGVSRQAVSAALARLKQRGLIETSHRHIKLLGIAQPTAAEVVLNYAQTALDNRATTHSCQEHI